MDVLTIQSCRAVRPSMRERCSTSEASAERPQEVVGRACVASSRPVKCRIWGWDQLPVHMRSGSVVVLILYGKRLRIWGLLRLLYDLKFLLELLTGEEWRGGGDSSVASALVSHLAYREYRLDPLELPFHF